MSWKAGDDPPVAIPPAASCLSQGPRRRHRATVVSAIRYIFAETSQSYDELFVPLLVNFLSLMLDQDLETVINSDLIRTVEMGPWTHKIDDGFGAHSQQEARAQIDSRLNKIASVFGPPWWDPRKRGFVPARLAVVIDGDTLAHAPNPELKEMLLNLGTQCETVVCCRVLVGALFGAAGCSRTRLARGEFASAERARLRDLRRREREPEWTCEHSGQ
ncbi:hypothetical protein B0H11DRAFT_2216074 [Mycena galericulata]|nr:hypothetical protein B0H11DRAFT_2216074 [Mycena galericulata]